MLKTNYKKQTILTVILISLVFTSDLFAQSARERAVKFTEEGDNFFRKQEYTAAIESYQKAITADANYLSAYSAMAFARINLHHHKLAAETFILYLEKVGVTGTKDITYIVTVLYHIGNQYRLAGEVEKSREFFDQALRAEPKTVQDYDFIARIYSFRGDLNNAVKYQIGAVNFSNSDDDSGPYISLSWYYSFLHKNQEAVDAATKSISINSNAAMAYTNRCRAYNDLKQYDKAIDDCKKALSLTADHGETQYYLANSYRRKGNAAEADRLNRLAIPNLAREAEIAASAEELSVADNYFLLGNAHFENENYAEAVKAYENGLKYNPTFPSLRFNLGMAYMQVGNKTGASEQYRQLLPFDSAKAKILKEQIDGE